MNINNSHTSYGIKWIYYKRKTENITSLLQGAIVFVSSQISANTSNVSLPQTTNEIPGSGSTGKRTSGVASIGRAEELDVLVGQVTSWGHCFTSGLCTRICE